MHRTNSRKKIRKKFKFLKLSKSFPSVQTCFGAFSERKVFSHCSMEGRAFENFQKNRKNFKIQKMPLMVSQSAPTCFEQTLGRCFWNFFLPSVPRSAFQIFWTYNFEFRLPNLKIWDQFSGLTKMSSVFRT